MNKRLKDAQARGEVLFALQMAEAEQLDALDETKRQIRAEMNVSLTRPVGSLTCNEHAKRVGVTRDAAKNWLNRRVEIGELESGWFKNVDSNGQVRRERWYRPNPAYVSPTARAQQRREDQREVCKVIADAVDAARAAENQAVQPYLEPAPGDESFNRYHHRHARAQAKYFEENPGTRAAHDAREAAGQVVYELQNGRKPHQRDVDLAQGFRWGNGLRQGLAGLLDGPKDGQDVE